MNTKAKNLLKLLTGTAITALFCLAGAQTDRKASATMKTYNVVVSSSVQGDTAGETTDITVSKFIIDDQRDIDYFDPELLSRGHAYKNPDRLDADPVELIIPKTYNGKTIEMLGATYTLHAGSDINTPDWTFCYGPFYKCNRLERVFIPDTVINAFNDGYSTFGDLGYSEKNNMDIYIYSDEIQSFFEHSYGIKIFKNSDVYYCALTDGEVLEELTVPDNITEIINGAFLKCKSLKKVTVPEQVTSIGKQAFLSPDLESIAIYNPDCELTDSSIANSSSYDSTNNKYVCSFDGVIYGYTNSTAQKYAEENGFTFAAIDKDNEIICTSKVTETTITTQTQTTRTTVSGEVTAIVSPVETTEDTQQNTTTKPQTSAATTTTSTTTTVITTVSGTDAPVISNQTDVSGDTDNDGILTVRDAANIAKLISLRLDSMLPKSADFNGDGKADVRDAAAIAAYLAKNTKMNK